MTMYVRRCSDRLFSQQWQISDHIAINRHIPGICILNPNLSVGENIEELILVALASEDGEYEDSIVYLPFP